MIIEIGDTLVSMDIITERFCCDLAKCKGRCCVEGDAGAPVTLDEMVQIEDNLDAVWGDLSASAQSVIDAQGVAYTDVEGELVTSIVNGKDCVFTCYQNLNTPDGMVENCCLCAYERAYRSGKIKWCKPISCALYPIRVKTLCNGMTALAYNRWEVCRDAVEKGRQLDMPLYRFLREPLINRFGEQWYQELCSVAEEIEKQDIQ